MANGAHALRIPTLPIISYAPLVEVIQAHCMMIVQAYELAIREMSQRRIDWYRYRCIARAARKSRADAKTLDSRTCAGDDDFFATRKIAARCEAPEDARKMEKSSCARLAIATSYYYSMTNKTTRPAHNTPATMAPRDAAHPG